MLPRTLVCITLLALCHLQLNAQALTNALPGGAQPAIVEAQASAAASSSALPDDPGQELLPVAQPEPEPPSGIPVELHALRQVWNPATKAWTLEGNVVVRYRDYTLRADKVIYRQATSEIEADGHIEVSGGPNDILIRADHGELRLDMHTARFFNVSGSQGMHAPTRNGVYATSNPLLFSGRVLIQTGEGKYRLIDGSITNCHLPKPDWRVISRTIALEDGKALTKNSWFEFLGMPLIYLPYLSHPVNETGRSSGLMIPVISNSSIKGFIIGEQVYWAINRSMDMVVGTEFYSKRGWAPNGDFRYRGSGLDNLTVRWNALLDHGYEQEVAQPGGAITMQHVNQGGVDIVADGRKDLSPETRLTGTVEYLSSYVYRLVFDDNFSQAVSSQVASVVSLTHAHNGRIPSIEVDRFQTYASTTNGDEVHILHMPRLRYDMLDRPLYRSPFYWSFGSSLGFLSRSEPNFHARNLGRLDIYPQLSLPIHAGGWSIVPSAALRETSYTISQDPDLTGARSGIPTISHDPIHRGDIEASLDIRPPVLERDFTLGPWHRVLRHVIEPEINYHLVDGIGSRARNVILIDTADIPTNTNEASFALTQRVYLKPTQPQPCAGKAAPDNTEAGGCPPMPREWASWTIAQKFFFDPNFGGALIPGRRNVFDSTLDLTGVAFLTSPRYRSPIVSRMRFEAVPNLRVQWDLDYDPKAGRFDADNLYAGYSHGRTTVGVGHALLNAVDEKGSSAALIKSQQLVPFLQIGKPGGNGLNLAANAGYDFTLGQLQYAGVQTAYNWDCCGLTLGYRRFQLGSVRDETQYLYSFTIANFGSVGDIRRSNTVFRDPSQPPPY